ncbi:MAG TPA: NAD-dependent deacylase [Myxococcota bacterium]|nr:NAD-dependent deacylase [Myxococcota bacterium]
MSETERARDALRRAERVLVVTGAGISAESGIPTFRGEGGLWRGFDATQLATPEAFARDPDLVWEWYRWRKQICNDAQPNAGHRAVAELEEQVPAFLLLTQNVDGLHPRAGSKKLVEIHGCIDTARCTRCGAIFPVPQSEDLPGCSSCGALARPHILWFGESYWEGTLDVGVAFARRADFCLVVGTSGMVWAPSAVALEAKQHGAFLVDVNPNKSEITAHADAWLQGPSGELLPELLGA